MINELSYLREEYNKIKESKNADLEFTEYKKVIKFKNKLDEEIVKLKLMINSLTEASEYSDSVSIAKQKLMNELDNLEIIKETL